MSDRGVCAPRTYSLVFKGIFLSLLVAMLVGGADAFGAGTGILKGRVFDYQTGKPIPEALITIQGTTRQTLGDKNGSFQIELPAGKYGISIHKEEYFNTVYQDVEIESGKITTYRCELVTGDPRQQFFFAIGGITVLDKRDILPDKIETTHEISSAEVEHYLSTNLGDILDMVPGVERTKNPGLSELTHVNLRGTGYSGEGFETQAARFGTKVMIDDIIISNNANMNSGTGTGYGSMVRTYAGTGIDLRTIPADNVEKVEVVTGVPSVEYGDLTTGLVKVKTKIGEQPHRLKVKSNPDTKEANVSGGYARFGTGISYNVNYAYSERDIRRENDEYSRYSGQLVFDNKFKDKRISILNKLYYTGVIDEYDVSPNDPIAVKHSNKDKTYIYGHSVEYNITGDTKLEWKADIKYTNRDSYHQQLTGSDVRVMSDALEPGTHEGAFDAGAYVWKMWTRGKEWNANAKVNLRHDFGLLRLNHSLLAGGEYAYEDNTGRGKIFNPLEPPSAKLGSRPLSFDAVPALQTASFYIEDNLNGFVMKRPYNLTAGFRYEMYTPEKLHLDGLFNEKGVVESKNGTYVNPRMRFKYEPFEGTQIRAGWGRNSKMPSLVNIYQGPYYIDVVDENVSPPDSVPLVTTYIFNYDNERLKGYQEEKTEVSLDQRIGPVGITFTGFYTSSDHIKRSRITPATVYRMHWENWPSDEGSTVLDTIYTKSDGSHGYYDDSGWHRKWGLECQIGTKRIEKLSSTFRVSSSFIKSRAGADGISLGDPKVNTVLGRTIYPYYYNTESWTQKMVVDYSVDWLIKRLGMWVTLFLQQTLFWQDLAYDNPIIASAGYYDPLDKSTVWITPAESNALGLDRTFDKPQLTVLKPGNDRVLFNINVSKSIGRGAEISFFVHNLFDDPAYYRNNSGIWYARTPDIFYGVEFSTILDNLFRKSAMEAKGE